MAGITPRDSQSYPHDAELVLLKRLVAGRPAEPRRWFKFKRMAHSWEIKFWRVTFIYCQLKHTYRWMLFWG